MIFVLSSCSDDTQETPDWREELYPSYRPVWVGEGLPPVGDNFERFGPGINLKTQKERTYCIRVMPRMCLAVISISNIRVRDTAWAIR